MCEYSQDPLSVMNHSVELHLGLLTDDAVLTKLQFAGLGTLQLTLFFTNVQRLLTCMSEPHVS